MPSRHKRPVFAAHPPPLTFSFFLPLYLALIAAPFLFLWPPLTTAHFSPTHCPFHFPGDAARSDSLVVLTSVDCNAIQSLRSSNTGVIKPSTAQHDCVSILHFPKNSTKTSRLLSAGEVLPLGVCYSDDFPCCEVSRIALLDAACSASSAPSQAPPGVTLHSPWRRRSTLGRLFANASTSHLSSSLASPVSPHPSSECRKHTTAMRANSENTALA